MIGTEKPFYGNIDFLSVGDVGKFVLTERGKKDLESLRLDLKSKDVDDAVSSFLRHYLQMCLVFVGENSLKARIEEEDYSKIECEIGKMKNELKMIDYLHPKYQEMSEAVKMSESDLNKYKKYSKVKNKSLPTNENICETRIFRFAFVMLFLEMWACCDYSLPTKESEYSFAFKILSCVQDIKVAVFDEFEKAYPCLYQRLLFYEFLLRYRFHDYILTPKMMSLARSIHEKKVDFRDIIGEDMCNSEREKVLDFENRVRVVLELNDQMRSSDPIRIFEEFETLKGSSSSDEEEDLDMNKCRSSEAYLRYLKTNGDLTKSLTIVESREKKKVEKYVLDGEKNLKYDGRTILTVPQNLEFSYRSFGDDYAVCLNPFFYQFLLVFSKGKITAMATTDRIEDLGNGYQKMLYSDDAESYFLYEWKEVRSEIHQDDVEVGEYSLPGGFLVDSKMVCLWKGIQFTPLRGQMEGNIYETRYIKEKKKKKTKKEEEEEEVEGEEEDEKLELSQQQQYTVSIFDGSVAHRVELSIIYESQFFLRMVVNDMFKLGKLEVLRDFSLCLDKWYRSVHCYDKSIYPDDPFTSFSKSYQKYVVSLCHLNRAKDSEFSKIPKEVLIHKILPCLSQIEIFFSINSSFKNAVLLEAYNSCKTHPGLTSDLYTSLKKFETADPMLLCIAIVSLRRNLNRTREYDPEDEILAKLDIHVKNGHTLYFGESSFIPKLFHHFFIEKVSGEDREDLNLQRLRSELLRFFSSLKDCDQGSSFNKVVEEKGRMKTYQYDISPLVDDLIFIVDRFKKKEYGNMFFKELPNKTYEDKEELFDLFGLLVSSKRDIYDFVSDGDLLDSPPSKKIVQESEKGGHLLVKSYEENNRSLSLEVMNKFHIEFLLKESILPSFISEISLFFEYSKNKGFENIDRSKVVAYVRAFHRLFKQCPKYSQVWNNSKIMDSITSLIIHKPEDGYPFSKLVFDAIKDEEAPFLLPMMNNFPEKVEEDVDEKRKYDPFHYFFQVGRASLDFYVQSVMKIFPNDEEFKRFFFPILNAYRQEWDTRSSVRGMTHYSSTTIFKFLDRCVHSDIISRFVEDLNDERFSKILFLAKWGLISSLLHNSMIEFPIQDTEEKYLLYLTILNSVCDNILLLFSGDNFFRSLEEKVKNSRVKEEYDSQTSKSDALKRLSAFITESSGESIFTSPILVERKGLVLEILCRFLDKVNRIRQLFEGRGKMDLSPKQVSLNTASELVGMLDDLEEEEKNSQVLFDKLLEDLKLRFHRHQDLSFYKITILYKYFKDRQQKSTSSDSFVFLKKENVELLFKTLIETIFKIDDDRGIQVINPIDQEEEEENNNIKNDNNDLAIKILSFIELEGIATHLPQHLIDYVRTMMISCLQNQKKEIQDNKQQQRRKVRLLPPFRSRIFRIFPAQSSLYTLELFNEFFVVEVTDRTELSEGYLKMMEDLYSLMTEKDQNEVRNELMTYFVSLLVSGQDIDEYVILMIERLLEKEISKSSGGLDLFSTECQQKLIVTFSKIVCDEIRSKRNYKGEVMFLGEWDASSHRILSLLLLNMKDEILKTTELITKIDDDDSEFQLLVSNLQKRFTKSYDYCNNQGVLKEVRKCCIEMFTKLFSLIDENKNSHLDSVFSMIRIRSFQIDLCLSFRDRINLSDLDKNKTRRQGIYGYKDTPMERMERTLSKLFSKEYLECYENFVMSVVNRFDDRNVNKLFEMETFKNIVWNYELLEVHSKLKRRWYVLESVEKKLNSLGIETSEFPKSKDIKKIRFRASNNNDNDNNNMKMINTMEDGGKFGFDFSSSYGSEPHVVILPSSGDQENNNSDLPSFFFDLSREPIEDTHASLPLTIGQLEGTEPLPPVQTTTSSSAEDSWKSWDGGVGGDFRQTSSPLEEDGSSRAAENEFKGFSFEWGTDQEETKEKNEGGEEGNKGDDGDGKKED